MKSCTCSNQNPSSFVFNAISTMSSGRDPGYELMKYGITGISALPAFFEAASNFSLNLLNRLKLGLRITRSTWSLVCSCDTLLRPGTWCAANSSI